MERLFAGLEHDTQLRTLVATSLTAEFCGELYAGGVRDFHFYTLNKAEITAAVCHLLGRRNSAATPETVS